MINTEATFPDHIRYYILSQCSVRLDKMFNYGAPSEEEERLLSRHERRWPDEIRPANKTAIRFVTIDNKQADWLMKNEDALEEKVFYLPAEKQEDAPMFRIVGVCKIGSDYSWKILWDGAGYADSVDGTELKALLMSSTYAVYN
ncbi:hypothetical protein SCHPADRAFT_172055 [Schizopora paradoxa]|uniref:Uncharacterized protein n=1 Tax=Schizopora paradoxa TaxID=27342 RepID=A0A0H2RZX5_9AGAM|nr:hypothetical protein SCHPADRAFT_172055 [Schizopora paradoxa]